MPRGGNRSAPAPPLLRNECVVCQWDYGHACDGHCVCLLGGCRCQVCHRLRLSIDDIVKREFKERLRHRYWRERV